MVTPKTTFSDILSQTSALNFVLQRYGLPTGCFNKPIKSTCTKRGMDIYFVTEILKAFEDTSNFPKKELVRFSIPIIINYLQRTHRFYLNNRLPEIEQSIFHLLNSYQHSHPLLMELLIFFYDYKEHLTQHIEIEESTLFPYINSLCEMEEDGISIHFLTCKIRGYCINNFIKAHSDTEDELKNVKKIVQRYKPDSTTISSYRILLTQLSVFEHDLHIHAQIENEVLVPKALKLENELKNKLKSKRAAN